MHYCWTNTYHPLQCASVKLFPRVGYVLTVRFIRWFRFIARDGIISRSQKIYKSVSKMGNKILPGPASHCLIPSQTLCPASRRRSDHFRSEDRSDSRAGPSSRQAVCQSDLFQWLQHAVSPLQIISRLRLLYDPILGKAKAILGCGEKYGMVTCQ